MRELHKVSACADTPVFRNKGIYAAVDEFLQQQYHGRIDSRSSLKESANACDHCCLDLCFGQRITDASGMAANDIILQLKEMFVIYTPLCHWSESGVYSVNHLVCDKAL